LYIVQLEVDDAVPIYTLQDSEYGAGWRKLSLLDNQQQGDRWMNEKKYLGIKVKSAVNRIEYNCLLNPGFLRFYDLVKIASVTEIDVDGRLV
jgi:hypothetical protein